MLQSKELALVHERLKNTAHHRLNEDVKDLKASIEECKQQISESKEVEKDRSAKHKEALYKIKNADELKKKELKVSPSLFRHHSYLIKNLLGR